MRVVRKARPISAESAQARKLGAVASACKSGPRALQVPRIGTTFSNILEFHAIARDREDQQAATPATP